MENWRTTILGVLAVVASLVGLLTKFFQGEPVTLNEILAIGTTISAGLGLIAAADAKKE